MNASVCVGVKLKNIICSFISFLLFLECSALKHFCRKINLQVSLWTCNFLILFKKKFFAIRTKRRSWTLLNIFLFTSWKSSQKLFLKIEREKNLEVFLSSSEFFFSFRKLSFKIFGFDLATQFCVCYKHINRREHRWA